MNRYGSFIQNGTAYEITNPHTPRPWVNFLTNGRYAALCSHRGGGFGFFLDHRYHGLLRRGAQIANDDSPGRFFYLHDLDSGLTWSPCGHPMPAALDDFRAVVEPGVTTIHATAHGIQTTREFFVPPALDAEVWRIHLHNPGPSPRRLALTSYAELALGNWFIDIQEPVFASLFNRVQAVPGGLAFEKQWWNTQSRWDEHNEPWPLRAFATTSTPPTATTADRDAFLGPFGSLARPALASSPHWPTELAQGRDACAAFRWTIDLPPGATWTTALTLGVQPRLPHGGFDLPPVPTWDQSTRWLADTRAWWLNITSAFAAHTPNTALNTMFAAWNQAQLTANFFFGRGPSYYHKSQYPSIRDQCQDTFGMTILCPELAREKLLHIASFFFADGRAGSGCNRIGIPETPSIKVDVPLWLGLAVADYVRETADWSILDQPCRLLDGPTLPLYQVVLRGLSRIASDRGPHGLPLIGRGDWNDAADQIGAKGRGESVWLAQFLCFVVHEVAFLLEARGDHALLADYRRIADEQNRIITESCWDGEWFIRAFKDDGTPVGARGPAEGFIWINSQTWAVMAGVGTPDQRQKAMDAVIRHLETPDGLMNLAPAYTQPDHSIGIITAFKPGWKENAAVFSHASAFNVCARAKLGRGADACRLFLNLLPVAKDPDRTGAEPYVYCQFVAGPAAGPEAGRGAWHWLTGTAAWMLRALADHILGIQASPEGLRLNPCVDPSWTTFSATRRFRGATYHLHFSNPHRVQTGITHIRLDGQPISGNLLPLPTAPTHHVEITMG